MKTVGDYKKAGLVFVSDDVVDQSCKNDGSCMEKLYELASSCNKGLLGYDKAPAGEFAWRTNTGEKPSFEGLVEFKNEYGDTYVASPDANDWRVGLCTGWKWWRPSLNQGEQVAPEKVSKPTYTREMQEKGELPPVGSMFLSVVNDIEMECLYSSKFFVIGVCQGLEFIFNLDNGVDCVLKPIKTDEEKTIDNAIKVIGSRVDIQYQDKEFQNLFLEIITEASKAGLLKC